MRSKRQQITLGLLCLLATVLVVGCVGCGGWRVYVTKGGSYYHTNRECPYLGSDAKAYLKSKVVRAGYKPCPSCTAATAPGVRDIVYIAPYSGKRYHRSRECRGLRNARSVASTNRDKARADGYTPCKICKPR